MLDAESGVGVVSLNSSTCRVVPRIWLSFVRRETGLLKRLRGVNPASKSRVKDVECGEKVGGGRKGSVEEGRVCCGPQSQADSEEEFGSCEDHGEGGQGGASPGPWWPRRAGGDYMRMGEKLVVGRASGAQLLVH